MNNTTRFSAARTAASLFGVLVGIAGATHGIGETLQGNVATNGIIINSWTVGPIATNLGGEPGMTIAPTLLLAGLFTIVVSIAIVVWSVTRVQKPNGGIVLIGLSIALLLAGGGMAPPVLGILAGVAGTGINSPYRWWGEHLSTGIQHRLANLWPWAFSICLLNGLFLVIGSVLLVYLFGLNAPDLFVASFFFAIVMLLLTILTGVARDLQGRDSGAAI